MVKKITTDKDGYTHEVEYDEQNKPLFGVTYDPEGNVFGEDIYRNGRYMGLRQHYIDKYGYEHEVEYNPGGIALADRKYDHEGKLIGEGVYRNGMFIGATEYDTDRDGYTHEVQYNHNNEPVRGITYDPKGNVFGNIFIGVVSMLALENIRWMSKGVNMRLKQIDQIYRCRIGNILVEF